MKDFRLVLIDPQPALCAAWQKYFANLHNVEIVNGYFEQLPVFDCIVSAANSFGLMDGGVDLAISNFFGRSLVHRVQKYILENFRGEQPIGTSFLIETGHEKHPFLAHTPTMRTPMAISLTDNVYYAMWAMLLAVDKHNRNSDSPIGLVACPGLGTATGAVSFEEAARQMSVAYENFLNPPREIDWLYATQRQQSIGRGGDLGLLLSAARNAKKGDN
ncbi:MAG TPA: macro domain-containing protein [Calditrichia bacterium]|nr:macro domain-containing protein [Calditrichia bacterium]